MLDAALIKRSLPSGGARRGEVAPPTVSLRTSVTPEEAAGLQLRDGVAAGVGEQALTGEFDTEIGICGLSTSAAEETKLQLLHGLANTCTAGEKRKEGTRTGMG